MSDIEKCSFCGELKEKTGPMVAGEGVAICGRCVEVCRDTLNAEKADKFRYSFEVLYDFFGKNVLNEYISTVLNFSINQRPDLQVALDELFNEFNVKRQIGLSLRRGLDSTDFMALLENGNRATSLGPLQYEDIDVGGAEPAKCLKNGLWLLEKDHVKIGLIFTVYRDYQFGSTLHLEIVVPIGEVGAKLTDDISGQIHRSLQQSNTYRGKILSFEVGGVFERNLKGVTVHNLEKVTESDIILPEATKVLIKRNILEFVENKEQLRAFGMSCKKGLLFYGPPGTGKTHTIHYLANQLKTHTTFLITAEQVALIGHYVALARILQPSIIVIEDADLIARSRESMNGPCEESLLNKLLNEMDGLREEAELLFILSTNNVESLEGAIASRPGRIDQAIEFPLPDLQCRKRLIELYGRSLKLDMDLVDNMAGKIDGVSAAFIKELMRRITQCMLKERQEQATIDHFTQAFDELVYSGGKVNAKLLGFDRQQVGF